MGVFFVILSFSIIGFFIHIYVSKERFTKTRILELLLLYQLIFSVGLTSLLAFIGLVFMPKFVADYMDWPTCPFQHELGNVNLAFAVLGILSIWYRGSFWLAIIIGLSIWLFGDAIGHIYEAVVYKNYHFSLMFTDIAVPLILIVLYVLYQRTKHRAKS